MIKIPVIILMARDTGHLHGNNSRKLTTKTVSKLGKRPIKELKTTIKAKRSPSPSLHPAAGKIWNTLTRHQQEIYIKQHPKTKRKITALRNRKITKAPIKGKSIKHPATVNSTKTKKKIDKKKLLKRAHKTLNPRQFNRAVAAELNNKTSADPIAAQAQEQADKIAEQAGKPEESTVKNSKEAVHAVFSHLKNESDNKIINHVNKHLKPEEKKLLNEAMQYAKAHPDKNESPPSKFHTILTRVLITALTVGIGGALMGPAGVMLAVEGLNTLKNKSGEPLYKFAYHAFAGKNLTDQEKDTDTQEDAVLAIIKHLKQQLAETNDDEQKEHYKTLIDNLDDKLDTYQKYEKPEKT